MNLFRKKDKKILFLLNQENSDSQLNLILAECIITEFLKFEYKCYCFYSNPFFILCENLNNVFFSNKSFDEEFIFEEIKKNDIEEIFLITFDEKTLEIARNAKKKFNIQILNEPLSLEDKKRIENTYSSNINLIEKKISRDGLVNFFSKNQLSTIDLKIKKKDSSICHEIINNANLNYLLSRFDNEEFFFKENIDHTTKFRVSFFLDKNKNYFIYSIGEYVLNEDKEDILICPAVSLTKDLELKIEETLQTLSEKSNLKPNIYSLDININANSKVFFNIFSDSLNIKNFLSNIFNFKYFICFTVDFFINYNFSENWHTNINKSNIFEKELCKMLYIDKINQNYRYFANKSIDLLFYELETVVGKKVLKKLKLQDSFLKFTNNKIDIQATENINEINKTCFISDRKQDLKELELIIFIEEESSKEKRFLYKQIYKKINIEKSIFSTTLAEEIIHASYLEKNFITISNDTLIKIIKNIKGLKYYFLFGDLYLNLDIINDLKRLKIKNALKNDSIKFLKNTNTDIDFLSFSEGRLSSEYVTDFKVIVIKNEDKIIKIFINVLRDNELYIINDNFLNFWIKDLEKQKTENILNKIEDFKFLAIHYTATDTDVILNSISFDLSLEIVFYSNLIDKNLISFILENSNQIEDTREKSTNEILVLKRKGDNFLILKDFTIGKIYFKMIKLFYKNVIKNRAILININKNFYIKYFTICSYLSDENFIIFSEDEDFIQEISQLKIKVFKYSKNINCSVFINQDGTFNNQEALLDNSILKLNHFLEVEFFIQGMKFFKKFWLTLDN